MLWFPILVFGFHLAFASNHTQLECTRACHIYDSDNQACWLKSISYFTEQFVVAANNYAAVRVHLGKWIHENEEDEAPIVDAAINTTVEDSSPLSAANVSILLNILSQQASGVAAEYLDEQVPSELPWVSCPIPASYDVTQWKLLTGISWAVTALTILTVALYIACSKSQHKEVAYQRQSLVENKSSGRPALRGPESNNVEVKSGRLRYDSTSSGTYLQLSS